MSSNASDFDDFGNHVRVLIVLIFEKLYVFA